MSDLNLSKKIKEVPPVGWIPLFLLTTHQIKKLVMVKGEQGEPFAC